MKSLHNTDTNPDHENVSDLVIWGEDALFKLISKASSEEEGWMKSTKAMDVHIGCIVQVTTQQRNMNGSYSVAEALTYVPGVRVQVIRDRETDEIVMRKLVPIADNPREIGNVVEQSPEQPEGTPASMPVEPMAEG
ncbi:MAG: hypothetical protein AAFZ74_02050 [Pseudomonadota bacterium]